MSLVSGKCAIVNSFINEKDQIICECDKGMCNITHDFVLNVIRLHVSVEVIDKFLENHPLIRTESFFWKLNASRYHKLCPKYYPVLSKQIFA